MKLSKLMAIFYADLLTQMCLLQHPKVSRSQRERQNRHPRLDRREFFTKEEVAMATVLAGYSLFSN